MTDVNKVNLGALGRLLNLARLCREVFIYQWRFDQGSAEISRLIGIIEDPDPPAWLEGITKEILVQATYLSNRLLGFRLTQPCLARTFCIAAHWSAAWGEPMVNIGLRGPNWPTLSGHIWLTLDDRLLAAADLGPMQEYKHQLSSEGRLRYWVAVKEPDADAQAGREDAAPRRKPLVTAIPISRRRNRKNGAA
jgi:hypothetical protein